MYTEWKALNRYQAPKLKVRVGNAAEELLKA
jgi:hypothetical protein